VFTGHQYLTQHYSNPGSSPGQALTRDEKRHLKEGAFRGWELVQAQRDILRRPCLVK
jgi:hypothetical protein